MKAYTQEEIISALEKAGFTVQLAEHHPKNPWLRILAIKK